MDNTHDIQQLFAQAGISVEVLFTGDTHDCPTCGEISELAA